MSDWQEASLADLADYINGRAIKPEECSTQQGIPVIRIKQINDPQSIEDRFCGDDLDEKNIARSGDLLFSWSATLKTILWQGPTGAINQHIFKVLPKEGIDKTFLHYLIDHSLPALTEESHGSTMKHIKKSALSAFRLQIPPLPEQKKIAEILSGIDHLIAITNRRMLSELDLRAGLLKETISEDGAFLKLDSVSTRVSGHTPSKSNPEYWNGGIPWISLSDTAKLDKRYISDTAKEISGQGIQNSSAVLHPAGLVVLSRDARVGCSAITTKKMAVSQHFIGWICSEQLLNRYLYYVLQKWKNKFEAIAMGSAIPTIGVPFFRDLEIPAKDRRHY